MTGLAPLAMGIGTRRVASVFLSAWVLGGADSAAQAREQASNEVDPSAAETQPAAPASNDVQGTDEASVLAAELAAAPASDTDSAEGKIDFYGFADFSYTQPISKAIVAVNSPFESFAIAHLNTYVGSELGEGWRWLAEVRFMYLPNGSVPGNQQLNPPPATDTSVTDYSDFLRPVRWGGISIERAWLERSFHPLFTVRLGQFLSPYGIWNVDHGSPVIIPVTRPYVVGEGLIPQHQTGIEIYGAWTDGGTQLGYHLTLSNGRGPIDTYQDLDHNKALGGRLFIRQDVGLGTLTLGTSAYRGDYTERHPQVGVDAQGYVINQYPVDQQYREFSWSADLKWEWLGFLLQGESVVDDISYSTGHRPIDPSAALHPGPPGFSADSRRYGYYALVAYRTPFWGIMPFVLAENYHVGSAALSEAAVRGGLNIHASPRVVLKAEYLHAWSHDVAVRLFRPLDLLVLQAAWSF